MMQQKKNYTKHIITFVMAKIVTLGEIMLRLSTPGQTRFVQTDVFDVVYGGGEANVYKINEIIYKKMNFLLTRNSF